MKMLIVMRHGKAKRLVEGQQDADRSLTKAGVMALEARLPYMLGLLQVGDRTVQVWTSPATRARQTAELLARALKEGGMRLAKDIEEHDCLWEQDIDAFLAELHAGEAECIFAVGHIPFIEELVEDLAGTTPLFATGAMACLEVCAKDEGAQADAPAPCPGRLLWFAQGPISAHWKTLVQLQQAITETAEAIEERRAAFLAVPDDIETIHRFRTKTRTLRSILAFAKPWQKAKQNAATQAALKEIVGYTSLLRELDVFEEQAHANPDSSPELLAFCAQQAAAERAKVLEVLASEHVSKAFDEAMAQAKNIVWKKSYCEHGLPKDEARARFDALVGSVKSDLDALDMADAERTHDVRKRSKRARYIAEFNKGVLGSDAAEVAQAMNEHQDNLGEVCDARANIRLITEFLQQDLPKPLASELAKLRAQNEALLANALE